MNTARMKNDRWQCVVDDLMRSLRQLELAAKAEADHLETCAAFAMAASAKMKERAQTTAADSFRNPPPVRPSP